MAELTVPVAKAIAEGQGATAWEIYQLARAFLHEHGMESPPYVEPAALSHAAGQEVVFSRDDGADWYSERGLIHVDFDHDPKRQLSLILKPDGNVGWAVYNDGGKWHGDDAVASFATIIEKLANPPASVEVGWDASLASIIPCRCFDEPARRLCLDRGICSRTYALAASSGRKGDPAVARGEGDEP